MMENSNIIRAFDPEQPRDDHGKWASAGAGKFSMGGWSQTGETDKAIKILHAEHGEHWMPKRGTKLEGDTLTTTKNGRDVLESKMELHHQTASANQAAAESDKQKLEQGESLGLQRHGDGSVTLHGGKVERETDKAVLYSHPDYENMWLPKSQVQLDGDKARIPAWLSNQKLVGKETEVSCRVVGETEKAHKLDVDVIRPDGEPQGATVFVPKNLAKIRTDDTDSWNPHRVKIPTWLKAAKESEYEASHSGGGFTFRLGW